MKKTRLALGTVLAIALSVPTADAILSSDYHGWMVHGNPPGTPGVFVIGESVTAYATLATFSGNAEWYPWDRDGNEYTAVITSSVTNVTDVGPGLATIVDFATASVSVYEDPSKNADYATPATFSDGTLLLTGALTNWQATLFTGDPGYVSGCDPGAVGPCPTLTWTDGPGLNAVECPELISFLDDAYTFDGVTLELGYTELFDAEWKCHAPVSVEQTTWGRVKTIYR